MGRGKDRRDIVLAIYTSRPRAHTHTRTRIYSNVTRSSLFSWVDAITDGKFAGTVRRDGRRDRQRRVEMGSVEKDSLVLAVEAHARRSPLVRFITVGFLFSGRKRVW